MNETHTNQYVCKRSNYQLRIYSRFLRLVMKEALTGMDSSCLKEDSSTSDPAGPALGNKSSLQDIQQKKKPTKIASTCN